MPQEGPIGPWISLSLLRGFVSKLSTKKAKSPSRRKPGWLMMQARTAFFVDKEETAV
jgi:hypothetical protein